MDREWLISLRKETGLTQKRVSELAKISQASYCTIESGKINPCVKTAKRIATTLGFDWTRFYEDEPK